jgi:protein TonB
MTAAAPTPTLPPATSIPSRPPQPTATPGARPAAQTPVAPSRAGGLYVEPDRVDRLPQLKRTVRPVYPAAALQERAGGIVLLRVFVSERGDPLEIEIEREVRPDLARAAREAVRRWSFEPARQGGRAVRTWTSVAVPFDPTRP